jgi:ATP-dependent helicase HrpA
LWEQYVEIENGESANPEQVEKLRWMIEEFRISCFAQPMKTRFPVSETKIRRLLEELMG